MSLQNITTPKHLAHKHKSHMHHNMLTHTHSMSPPSTREGGKRMQEKQLLPLNFPFFVKWCSICTQFLYFPPYTCTCSVCVCVCSITPNPPTLTGFLAMNSCSGMRSSVSVRGFLATGGAMSTMNWPMPKGAGGGCI